MPLPTTKPHDSLFRALVSNPRRAAALLREHLPKDMAALIDFQHPPEPQEGSFVDGTGAKTRVRCLVPGSAERRTGRARPKRVGFDRIDVFTRQVEAAFVKHNAFNLSGEFNLTRHAPKRPAFT